MLVTLRDQRVYSVLSHTCFLSQVLWEPLYIYLSCCFRHKRHRFWSKQFFALPSNFTLIGGVLTVILPLYTITSVCIFFILFSAHFQRFQQGES